MKPTQHFSSLARKGLHLANINGCFNCHSKKGEPKTGPTLKGLYNRQVALKNGETVTADTAYLRNAINHPNAQITAGYYAVMPKYTRFNQQEVAALVAYIKALGDSTRENVK